MKSHAPSVDPGVRSFFGKASQLPASGSLASGQFSSPRAGDRVPGPSPRRCATASWFGPRLRIDPDMNEGYESWPTHGHIMANWHGLEAKNSP